MKRDEVEAVVGWRNVFSNDQTTAKATSSSAAQPPVRSPIRMDLELQPVQMTGTTTFGADALTAFFTSRRIPDGGMIEAAGQLVREPDNPADPNAVAILVEGERIGYLPGYLASQVPLAHDEVSPCKVQLWGTRQPKGLRVIGWVAAGRTIAWLHSPSNPPAVTTKEQATARSQAVSDMVSDALSGPDPHRAAQFRAGMVQGYHYLETVEPIKQLKREGRLEEALTLCYGAIAAAEADRRGAEPAPWYTEQAAIIHRKLGQREQEIAVLQRWLDHCPKKYRAGSPIQQRLDKILKPKS